MRCQDLAVHTYLNHSYPDIVNMLSSGLQKYKAWGTAQTISLRCQPYPFLREREQTPWR